MVSGIVILTGRRGHYTRCTGDNLKVRTHVDYLCGNDPHPASYLICIEIERKKKHLIVGIIVVNADCTQLRFVMCVMRNALLGSP